MIFWAGLLVVKDRKVLGVREKGKSFFALPGGSKKNEESVIEILKREIKEELSIDINFPISHFMETELPGKGENDIVHFNVFTTNESNVVNKMKISDDIEEFMWINYRVLEDNKAEISHLIERKILPDLKLKNLID